MKKKILFYFQVTKTAPQKELASPMTSLTKTTTMKTRWGRKNSYECHLFF